MTLTSAQPPVFVLAEKHRTAHSTPPLALAGGRIFVIRLVPGHVGAGVQR